MTDIYIPFPKELYEKILIRSGGKLDPAALAADQVEDFVDRNMLDANFWTEEGLEAFEREASADNQTNDGDPERGYQWQSVLLRNGSELRMRYQGRYYYARVSHERVVDEDGAYTPAEWVRKVANHTSRNAWRDIWVKFPGEASWHFADTLRQQVDR